MSQSRWVAVPAALVLFAALAPGSAADQRSIERRPPTDPAAVAEQPVVGVRPVAGRVVRTFDPPATKYGAGHRGVDLRARAGQPVVAALGGTVTFAGAVAGVSWITVGHGGGLSTAYGPVEPRVVRAGEVVSAGDVLGFVAAGARHLDWGARLDGQYIDPLSVLGEWETYLTTSDDVVDLPPLGGLAAAGGFTPAAGGGRLLVPASGPVTSAFGPRVHPVTGQHRQHAGVDFGAAYGSPIRAAAAGTVTFAGALSGYGNTVMIDHGRGISTLYAHQSTVAVGHGQRVRAGQLLGRVGSSGLSTGPHLHFEVRVNGAPRDPLGWLRR